MIRTSEGFCEYCEIFEQNLTTSTLKIYVNVKIIYDTGGQFIFIDMFYDLEKNESHKSFMES